MNRTSYRSSWAGLVLVGLISHCCLSQSVSAAAKPQSKPRQTKASKGSGVKPSREMTIAEVRQIEQRLPRLKQGMAPDKVMKVLGMSGYKSPRGVMGDGPANDYRFTYYLRTGSTLMVVYDYTKRPVAFKRAQMLKGNAARVSYRSGSDKHRLCLLP